MVEKKRTKKTTAKSQEASDLPEQHSTDLSDFLGEDTANEALGDLDVDDSDLSLEALFKKHGIEFPDMSADTDNITMSDTAHEMENFSLNEPEEPVAPKTATEPEFDDPFKEIFAKMGLPENFNDIDIDQFAQKTAPFMDEPSQPEPVRSQKKQSGASMLSSEPSPEESIFETEAFEDVNADFPEEKRSRDIPETSLFDYDLNETNDAMASSELGGADAGDVPPPIPPRKKEFPWASKFPNKRILLRAGILVGLGAGIYLLLQGLLPHAGEDIPMSAELESPVPVSAPAPHAVTGASVAEAPEEALKPIASTQPEPPIDLSVAAQEPSAPAAAPAVPPTAAATATVTPPTTPVPSAVAPATANVDLSNLQAQATAPATAAPTLTAVQEPKPATQIGVAAPSTSLAVTPAGALASGASVTTEDKLDQLEVTLKSLDQRLMQLTNTGSASSQWTVNPQSSGSDTQAALNNAVKKMNELDKKLGRIAELQQQLRALDTEVQSLKNSVSQQNEIMGAQQRLFNGNIVSQDGYEAGPVKMFVQAAIPGRAWLRSEQGELITVIPGDEVPGYGRVMNIDAVSGTVVTSSRAVFREQ